MPDVIGFDLNGVVVENINIRGLGLALPGDRFFKIRFILGAIE